MLLQPKILLLFALINTQKFLFTSFDLVLDIIKNSLFQTNLGRKPSIFGCRRKIVF